MTINYNAKLYRRLQRVVPEGFWVTTNMRGKQLVITIGCDDVGYFSPWWQLPEILQEFGYR